jgi:hypothetical protein
MDSTCAWQVRSTVRTRLSHSLLSAELLPRLPPLSWRLPLRPPALPSRPPALPSRPPALPSRASTSAADRTSCQCNAGYTGSACTTCIAGKYKSVTGSGTCTDCAAGKYSATIGAAAEAACLTCPGASTSAADRTSCPCNAGYTGSACTACPAGKYKPDTGSGECTTCAAGKYSATVGATENCFACPEHALTVTPASTLLALVRPQRPCVLRALLIQVLQLEVQAAWPVGATLAIPDLTAGRAQLVLRAS